MVGRPRLRNPAGVLLALALLVAVLPAGVVRAASSSPADWTWSERSGPVAPPAGAGTLLAYDSAADRFVFFGGWDGTTLNQTWEFDPVRGTWTELYPPASPTSRADSTFLFDPAQNEFLLFGGWTQYANGTDHRLNDTWAFSLSADRWTDLQPASAPSPRSDSAAAWDPTNGTLFLYGGFSGARYLGDAWAFDPAANTWRSVPTSSVTPGIRADGRMVYDSATRLMLLFGGNDYSGPNLTFHHLNDTWAYSVGTNRWTELAPAASPPARDYAAEGYDPSTGQVLLFGGYGNRTILSDTWGFSPARDTWSLLPVTTSPPGRYAGGGGFDTQDDLFLIVGGLGNVGLLNDTWSLEAVSQGSAAAALALPLLAGFIGFGAVAAVVAVRAARPPRSPRPSG